MVAFIFNSNLCLSHSHPYKFQQLSGNKTTLFQIQLVEIQGRTQVACWDRNAGLFLQVCVSCSTMVRKMSLVIFPSWGLVGRDEVCRINGVGCSRDGAAEMMEMFHSKPWDQAGLLTQAHLSPCSICKALCSGQAGRGDGNGVSVIGKAEILHLSPLFQVLENTVFKEIMLVMILLGATGWSRAFLTHTSVAVGCQNRSLPTPGSCLQKREQNWAGAKWLLPTAASTWQTCSQQNPGLDKTWAQGWRGSDTLQVGPAQELEVSCQHVQV